MANGLELLKTKVWEWKIQLGVALLLMIALAFAHKQPLLGFLVEVVGIVLIVLPSAVLIPLQKKTSKKLCQFISFAIVLGCALALWYPDMRGMIESTDIKALVLVFGMGALLYLTRLN